MRASRPFGSGSGKSFKSGRLLLAADAAALSQKEQYEEEPNESSDVEARRPRRWIRFAGWQVGRAVWGAEPCDPATLASRYCAAGCAQGDDDHIGRPRLYAVPTPTVEFGEEQHHAHPLWTDLLLDLVLVGVAFQLGACCRSCSPTVRPTS